MKREQSILLGAMFLCTALAACAGPAASAGGRYVLRSNSSAIALKVVDAEDGTEVAAGTSPLTLRRSGTGLYRGGTYRVTVSQAGALDKQFTLKLPTVNFGGLLGWIVVDPGSGELFQLATERSGIEWQPAPQESGFDQTPGFVIATLDDVKPSPSAVANMKALPMRALAVPRGHKQLADSMAVRP